MERRQFVKNLLVGGASGALLGASPKTFPSVRLKRLTSFIIPDVGILRAFKKIRTYDFIMNYHYKGPVEDAIKKLTKECAELLKGGPYQYQSIETDAGSTFYDEYEYVEYNGECYRWYQWYYLNRFIFYNYSFESEGQIKLAYHIGIYGADPTVSVGKVNERN